jgi:hypothetical protein
LGAFFGRSCSLRAGGNHFIDRRSIQIMHLQMETRLEEILCHGLSHDSQSDESNALYLSQGVLL